MAKYQVIVGNVGTVYDGDNKRGATATYSSYVFDSKNGYGRAAGEQVTLFAHGEPIKEFDPSAPAKPKASKPIPLPDEVWVMYLSMHNAAGSISHVSNGDKFYRTKEACQKAIDEMPGWIGMHDRCRYRPMQLVSGEKEQ